MDMNIPRNGVDARLLRGINPRLLLDAPGHHGHARFVAGLRHCTLEMAGVRRIFHVLYA